MAGSYGDQVGALVDDGGEWLRNGGEFSYLEDLKPET